MTAAEDEQEKPRRCELCGGDLDLSQWPKHMPVPDEGIVCKKCEKMLIEDGTVKIDYSSCN